MKGVILCSGMAKRLQPMSFITNKHLLPVYNKPVCWYPIQTLVEAGITDILMVVGGPHVGHFLPALKDGKALGIKHLEYAYQDEPKGIAHGISLAEEFADGEDICVILGDNVLSGSIKEAAINFSDSRSRSAGILLKKVKDPERFGCPIFDENGDIFEIIEKPGLPAPSDFAVIGVYFYDSSVFDKIRTLTPSSRGELEVTSLNNLYLNEGNLHWDEFKGDWFDIGQFDSLLACSNYWQDKVKNG